MPDVPSPARLKSDTETGKGRKTRTDIENEIGTKTETRTEIEIEIEEEKETETEKEKETETTIGPAAIEETTESLAREKKKDEREDDVLVAESTGVPKGPKEAGKRGMMMMIEIDTVTGNADGMDVLLSHRLSKTLMALTSLPSREPSQSPLLQPPLQYLAPQDSLQPLLIGQYKTPISPTAGRKSENGVLLETMMMTGEVVAANRSRCRRLDITTMSLTAIQTN